MISQQTRGDVAKVSFSLPLGDLQGPVSVVGDFNDWDPTATPMRRHASSYVASMTLVPGVRYAFRYFGTDAGWFNDGEAHDYEVNEWGDTNSILES